MARHHRRRPHDGIGDWGKAARGREEVFDLTGGAWEESLDLAGGHTTAAKAAWQGCRVMWDRVEALNIAGSDGG
uniref:Uncharacterized protein n=1 Tax=Oryza barthii TaxID=65489 RepID=A0A0D3GQG1_9ORYZ